MPDCKIVITLGRKFTGIEVDEAKGEIKIPFSDVVSAQQAMDELTLFVRLDHPVIMGEVIRDGAPARRALG